MLRDIRKNYSQYTLNETDLTENPLELFESWLKFAIDEKINEPTAMILSTCDKNQPDSRVVLLKDLTASGFVFFTNYLSTKGLQLEKNKNASLVFFWPELERQVRIKGYLEKTSNEFSTSYFKSRPIDSQIAAIASKQSSELTSREILEKKVNDLTEGLKNTEIKKPKHWGGYIVHPFEIEFWQGRPNRLHDRYRYYLREENNWDIKRLYP